jgi:GTP-binding protein
MDHLPATFERSAAALADCPRDAIPEVAFAGRSNAGKSSVLNALAGRRALARVSRTPGRTQLINFFRVVRANGPVDGGDARDAGASASTGGHRPTTSLPDGGYAADGRLVDLPGYGYAAAAHAARDRWQRNVNVYLSQRRNLRGLVVVMDIRHPLKDSDGLALEAAAQLRLPALALLNKADKLGRAARADALAEVRRRLPDGTEALVFSARDGTGLSTLATRVRGWLWPSTAPCTPA